MWIGSKGGFKRGPQSNNVETNLKWLEANWTLEPDPKSLMNPTFQNSYLQNMSPPLSFISWFVSVSIQDGAMQESLHFASSWSWTLI